MYIQILLTLILMISYFILFFKIGIPVSKVLGRRVCTVCYSVSLTWISLLLIDYFGLISISKYLISIVMVQSVVGISNLSEEFLIINYLKMSQPLLKFGTILYGTLSVLIYGFFSAWLGLMLMIPLMVLGYYSMTPVRRIVSGSPQPGTLLSKLKDCCG